MDHWEYSIYVLPHHSIGYGQERQSSSLQSARPILDQRPQQLRYEYSFLIATVDSWVVAGTDWR